MQVLCLEDVLKAIDVSDKHQRDNEMWFGEVYGDTPEKCPRRFGEKDYKECILKKRCNGAGAWRRSFQLLILLSCKN